MWYQIISKNGSKKIFDSQPVKLLSEGNEFEFNESTLIAGDIKIQFLNKAKVSSSNHTPLIIFLK